MSGPLRAARYSALPASSRPPACRPAPARQYIRRRPDRSQIVRLGFQTAFVLLNLWIGARFYLWVRFYESGGATVAVTRPPGVEGWLPIAALMNLKYVLVTGDLPPVHAAGLFLLVAFLAISLLLRKAFCSWLCPIGTLSEWLWQGGREMFGRTLALPRWADVALRGLKYVLFGLFFYAVASMSAADLRGFLGSPYGLVADVKMLDFFRTMGPTAALVVFGLVLASLVVKNAWCRYLCPYGAMLGLVSLASPTRIHRDPEACIDCAKCAAACPALLPVDRLAAVRSAECTACLACVAACPSAGALDLVAGRRRRVPGWAVGAAVAVLFLAAVGAARLAGVWHTTLPDALLFDLIPRARDFMHP
jgi:polyferredoxin